MNTDKGGKSTLNNVYSDSSPIKAMESINTKQQAKNYGGSNRVSHPNNLHTITMNYLQN